MLGVDTLASGLRPDGPIGNRSAGWATCPTTDSVFITIGGSAWNESAAGLSGRAKNWDSPLCPRGGEGEHVFVENGKRLGTE